jgi:hypothetical protein
MVSRIFTNSGTRSRLRTHEVATLQNCKIACRDELQDMLDGTRSALERATVAVDERTSGLFATVSSETKRRMDLEVALADAHDDQRKAEVEVEVLQNAGRQRDAAYNARLSTLLEQTEQAERQMKDVAVCSSLTYEHDNCVRHCLVLGSSPFSVPLSSRHHVDM